MKYITKAVLLLTVLCLICGCTPTNTGSDTPATPGNTEKPSTTDSAIPVTTADNLLLDKNAKQNTAVLPRGVTKDHTWIKSAAGNTLTFYYPAQQDAFTFHNGKTSVGESSWLRSLKEDYDITLHAVRKSPASALSAQRLAMLSGLQLDLLAFTPAQLPYAMSLTADATALLDKQTDSLDFLNTTLLSYGSSGKRFFTPAGVARNLWYLSDSSDTTPLTLSESKQWDVAAFSSFIATHTKLVDGKVSVYGYEVQDYTDFLTAMGTPLVSYDTAFIDGSAATVGSIKKLQQINAVAGRYYNGKSTDENAPALAKGTLSMRYGQTPFVGKSEKYPAFSWAPLPTAERDQSEGTLSACAPILALPKNGVKNEIALNVALLWSARFADANHDLLRFTYGMSYESWEQYYNATNRLITVVYAAGETETAELLTLATAAEWDETKYASLCSNVAATVKSYNERLPQ